MLQTRVLDREMNSIAIPLSGSMKIWRTEKEQWKAWSRRYGKQRESNGRPGAEGMANRQRAMESLELKVRRTDREHGRPGAEDMANRERGMEGLELKVWQADREL